MTMFELLNGQLLVRTSLSKETTAVVLGLSLYKLLFKEKRDLGECSVHILRGPWISRRKKEWSNQNNNAVQWVFYLTSAQETTYVSIYKCYVCSRYILMDYGTGLLGLAQGICGVCTMHGKKGYRVQSYLCISFLFSAV